MNMEQRQAAADSQTRPNDPGCESSAGRLPVGCQKPHPPSPFIIITQPDSWYSFYHPSEGRWLSLHRHCSKGVQSKAVYRSSGFYWKHATALGGIRTLVLSHRSQAHYHYTTTKLQTFLFLRKTEKKFKKIKKSKRYTGNIENVVKMNVVLKRFDDVWIQL